MKVKPNILTERDLQSLTLVENAFRNGPIAKAMQSAPSIERRRNLSREEFEQVYRRQKRPVLMEGVVDNWPAIKTWSFDYLAQRCGSARVVVNSYSSQRAQEVTFSEFVQLLNKNQGPDAKPLYLQEWYYKTVCPWLSDDMPELNFAHYDFRRNLYGDAAATNHQLWIGQKGGITRLHQDSYMVDVMHVQIVGKKRWCIMSPKADLHYHDNGTLDFDALCKDPDTQLMQFDLNPGEVLYLPALWFHRIELLSDSVGLGRKCLDESNLQMHIRLRMAELLALALNPDEIKRTHPELFDVVMIRNRAWAKRMNIDLTKLRP